MNNMPFVAESIIIQQTDSKLAALVYPDFDDAFAHGLNNDAISTSHGREPDSTQYRTSRIFTNHPRKDLP